MAPQSQRCICNLVSCIKICGLEQHRGVWTPQKGTDFCPVVDSPQIFSLLQAAASFGSTTNCPNCFGQPKTNGKEMVFKSDGVASEGKLPLKS